MPEACTSSAEIERRFPYPSPIIVRGSWSYSEHAELNGFVKALGPHRSGSFNGITCFHFAQPGHAAALAEYAYGHKLHRLKANSLDGATRQEVYDEWIRLADEREHVLAWARATNMFRDVVQAYRFERKRGSYSSTAHAAAGRAIELKHPEVHDPLNYAGVLIVWAEREHRAWFWRCCRDHHVL